MPPQSRQPKPLRAGFKLVFFSVMLLFAILIAVLLFLGSYPGLTPLHEKLSVLLLDVLKINVGIIFGLLGGFLSGK